MVTIVTAFAPERFWTLDIWQRTLAALDLPCHELIIVDNTGDADMSRRIQLACARLESRTYRIIKYPGRVARADSLAVATHLASIWNGIKGAIQTKRTLSLESDVLVEQSDAARLLMSSCGTQTPIVGCPIRSRQHGKEMVYALTGASGGTSGWQIDTRKPLPAGDVIPVGYVSMGFTVLDTAFLQGMTFAPRGGRRKGHDFSLMAACHDAGRRILCDRRVKPRHYVNQDKWI